MKNDNWEVKYASFGRRALAYLVDTAILATSLTLINLVITFALGKNPFAPARFDYKVLVQLVLGFLFVTIYDIYFWTQHQGQTPGDKLLAIQIKSEGSQKISYLKAIVRHFSSYLSRSIFFLGYFWVIWDKKKQAWHDKLAKTIVIETDQKPKKVLAILIVIFLFALYTIYIGTIAVKAINLSQKELQIQQKTNAVAVPSKEKSEAEMHISIGLAKMSQAQLLQSKAAGSPEQYQKMMLLFQDAAKEFTLATEKEPKSYLAWCYLGNTDAGLMGFEEGVETKAIAALNKSLTIEPKSGFCQGTLGYVYFQMNQFEDAVTHYEQAVQLDPRGDDYYHLGLSYKYLGRTDDAKKAFQKAAEYLAPSDPLRKQLERENGVL